ncbi:MAG: CinA family protein [Oscillospiraceae bacterium]|nr:CinA family protein [Oscillospiraceae bacterium]
MHEEYDENKIREDYKKLTKYLISKQLTVTTMESATSGLIASLITDTEGASAVFNGSFVTYSNEAKIKQGVPAEIIDKNTVYSKETAKAMAKAAFDTYNTDLSIGVTGTMGNTDPANPENSVPGQVHFGIKIKEDIYSYTVSLDAQSSRFAYKISAAKKLYDILAELLEI